VVINRLFDNLSLCIINGYYSKNIHNLTSTQMFIKKTPTHRIYEKKINSQSTVEYIPASWKPKISLLPHSKTKLVFSRQCCAGYSQFYLIRFVQSSHLLTKIQSLHPYLKTYIKWEVSKCSNFIFIFLWWANQID
jgi:hypothetical protein